MAKILIIDCEPGINLYYQDAFEKIDVETLFLDNFESALYILSIENFDAVIIDPVYKKGKVIGIGLDFCEGFELIKAIREKYKKTPIIVNSALDDLEEYFKKYNLPVDSYLIKSFDESELVSTVINLLSLTMKYKASSKKKAKIFISYAKDDFSKAYAIYEVLKQSEYNPWIDHVNLFPGQDWELEIEKSIQNSNFFIALLSKNSVNKEGYFQKELKKGIDILDQKPEGSIYLIPVRLDNCEVPRRFAGVQWCNAFEENGLERLMKAIEFACKERGIINE